MQIIKIIKRETKTYRYRKIYFSNLSDFYCVKINEDLFLKKKEKTWEMRSTLVRQEQQTGTHKYWYFPISVSKNFEIIFHKTYKEYIFNIRKDKLKRLSKYGRE